MKSKDDGAHTGNKKLGEKITIHPNCRGKPKAAAEVCVCVCSVRSRKQSEHERKMYRARLEQRNIDRIIKCLEVS